MMICDDTSRLSKNQQEIVRKWYHNTPLTDKELHVFQHQMHVIDIIQLCMFLEESKQAPERSDPIN